jgi:hypothetical protein
VLLVVTLSLCARTNIRLSLEFDDKNIVIIVHRVWNLIFFAKEDGTVMHITWTAE